MRVSVFFGVLALLACLGTGSLMSRVAAEEALPKAEAAPKVEAAPNVEAAPHAEAVSQVQTITIVEADKEAGTEPKKIEARVVLGIAGGSHWLGILTVPVDDGLKSQLKLDDRVIVQQVIPDSPAAKAGLKQYDILLKIGEADIHSVQDLMKTVEKNPDKEMKLQLLREAKEETLNIKPEKRPENSANVYLTPEIQKLQEKVNVWVQAKGGALRPDEAFQLRFVGPGFVGESGKSVDKFPEDLSVSVSKEGDKPAKIVVQKKDQKWEIKEDELDKLPAEVRPFVVRMLGHGAISCTVAPGRMLALPPIQAVPGVPVYPQSAPVPVPAVNPEQVRKAIELHREILGADAVGELRKQLEELRKEVEQLKVKPADASPEKKP